MSDQYGRTVILTTDASGDHYQVNGLSGEQFTVTFPHGTSFDQVFSSINAMAPSGS